MEVERATFEKVNTAQLDLIFTHIMHLAKEKQALDERDRRDYFDKYACATLGMDIKYDFILDFEGVHANLGPLAVYARKMAFFEDTKDNKQEIFLKGKKTKVPMEALWLSLRDNLYETMSEALTLALRSSAEITKRESGSFGYTPGDNIEQQ